MTTKRETIPVIAPLSVRGECLLQWYDSTGFLRSIQMDTPMAQRILGWANAHEQLADACAAALKSLRAWNGMGLGVQAEEAAWELYRHSPEVQSLEAALRAAGREVAK